jgi:deoxyribose-phosphate aldolase
MINNYLEATNLNEKANYKEIRDSLKEAIFNNCVGFCTYLTWSVVVNNTVKLVNSNIKKVYVLGFYTGQEKLIERDLDYVQMSKGDEFDVVFPLALLARERYINIAALLTKVRKVTEGKILKVIIETNVLRQLPKPEKSFETAITIAESIGADYIKSNTGRFKREKPIQEDIKLIQSFTKLPIKAAGGVRDYKLAKELIDMGVKRIGVSYPTQIIEEEKNAIIK